MTTTLASRRILKRLFLLLYGPPKSGKSVTAHCMHGTRTLDFDDGMQSIDWAIIEGIIKRKPEEIAFATIKPPLNEKKGKSVLSKATAQIDEWIDEEDIPPEEWDKIYPQLWDTLIVDSATFLTEGAIMRGLSENSRLGISKTWKAFGGGPGDVIGMRVQDWGSASRLFWKFTEQITTLGKNVVMVAHEYHNTSDEGAVISIDPLVIGQLRQKLPALFDEVWYQSASGSSDNLKFRIQTKRDLKRNLGSRLGCLDAKEIADFDAIRKKVAKFYGVKPGDLWNAYHGKEGVKRAIREAEEEATI